MALTIRELKAFWYSPIGYVVGATFLLLQGFTFAFLLTWLSDPRTDPSVTMVQLFFGTIFYWFTSLMIPPLITMRSFSEEKRSGTIEFLLTSPVSDTQIVLAKFLGAWLCYLLLWLATLPFFLALRAFLAFDWGPVISAYVGVALMSSVLIAVGIWSSSLTRNQVIAAVIAFVAIMVLLLMGLLRVFIHDPEQAKLLQYLSLLDQMGSFSKGIIDTRPIVFYTSLTAIFLFLTGRVVSNPRWRS